MLELLSIKAFTRTLAVRENNNNDDDDDDDDDDNQFILFLTFRCMAQG